MRTNRDVANEILECASSWNPDVCLLGNVTVLELADLISDWILRCDIAPEQILTETTSVIQIDDRNNR